jgi:hypothetical protein
VVPQHARTGTRVRVLECRQPEFRGMVGEIVKRYGTDEYLALDVRLEDGRSKLFWHHELEPQPRVGAPKKRRLFRLLG